MSGREMDLTVYERRDSFPCGYLVPTEMVSGEVLNVLRRDEEVDRMSARKRLTGAELAAEYWRAMSILWTMLGMKSMEFDLHDELAERAQTLCRFAALPHYDEGEAWT